MRVLTVLLVAGLAACGSSTAPAKGAAHFAIVSGNGQTAVAGHAKLTQPVTGQLYRKADGSVAFRLLDFALPAKAFAQTTVPGAGIVGAVTCWADVPGHPRLIPFSECVNTDASGMVTYNLSDDTLAGSAQGEVHWDSSGVAIVTATVNATILAGDVWPSYKYGPGHTTALPAVVSDSSAKDRYGNPVPFRIVDPTGQLVVSDTTTGSVGARTIVSGLDFQTAPGGAGYTVELRGPGNVLLGHCRYEIIARTSQLNAWVCGGTDIATP